MNEDDWELLWFYEDSQEEEDEDRKDRTEMEVK